MVRSISALSKPVLHADTSDICKYLELSSDVPLSSEPRSCTAVQTAGYARQRQLACILTKMLAHLRHIVPSALVLLRAMLKGPVEAFLA